MDHQDQALGEENLKIKGRDPGGCSRVVVNWGWRGEAEEFVGTFSLNKGENDTMRVHVGRFGGSLLCPILYSSLSLYFSVYPR